MSRTAPSIRQRIEKVPRGQPFTAATFLPFATRACIDQSLSRLAKAGKITRVTRGIYVHAARNRFVGAVLPEPLLLAQFIAAATGSVVQVHGAEAARRLELTTQVPMRPVFLTSGPARRFRIRNLEVVLKHATPRKLMLAGRPAGLALSALWYLGRQRVTAAVVEAIHEKLPRGEFEALLTAAPFQPAWMVEMLRGSTTHA